MADIVSSFKSRGDQAEGNAKKLLSRDINSLGLAFACMQAIRQTTVPTLELIAIGSFNAVFKASFPSGDQVIARLPLSMKDTNIASTVATMTYAKHIMQVHCPAILAWSNISFWDSGDNVVGMPYIIMEKSPGTSLAECWKTMSLDS